MLLLIDNFDSFTFNLVHAFHALGVGLKVVRNSCSVDACIALQPSGLVVGPGPGDPDGAGCSLAIIEALAKKGVPTLGVCLGHQAIAQSFGGKVIRAQMPMHGKLSTIYHTGYGLFSGVPNPFSATRYHSLIACRKTIPSCLEISAETAEGEIMAIQHRFLPIYGVQFHPESIATPEGWRLFDNFLKL